MSKVGGAASFIREKRLRVGRKERWKKQVPNFLPVEGKKEEERKGTSGSRIARVKEGFLLFPKRRKED